MGEIGAAQTLRPMDGIDIEVVPQGPELPLTSGQAS